MWFKDELDKEKKRQVTMLFDSWFNSAQQEPMNIKYTHTMLWFLNQRVHVSKLEMRDNSWFFSFRNGVPWELLLPHD